MIVLGMSRRASFVSSAPSRRTPPGCGIARCRKVSSCSSLSPSRFSSSASSSARGQGHLDALEVGVHRAGPGGGVDIHHGRDPLGHPVARGIAGEPGAAVHGEHDGSSAALTASQIASTWSDMVIGIGRRRPTRDRAASRGDVVAVGTQRGRRPRPTPTRRARTRGPGRSVRWSCRDPRMARSASVAVRARRRRPAGARRGCAASVSATLSTPKRP